MKQKANPYREIFENQLRSYIESKSSDIIMIWFDQSVEQMVKSDKEKIAQLKAKAERDLDTFNKNDLFYTNEIIRIERNSVSTEYLEETVLHYKKQIIKLKQEIEALKN